MLDMRELVSEWRAFPWARIDRADGTIVFRAASNARAVAIFTPLLIAFGLVPFVVVPRSDWGQPGLIVWQMAVLAILGFMWYYLVAFPRVIVGDEAVTLVAIGGYDSGTYPYAHIAECRLIKRGLQRAIYPELVLVGGREVLLDPTRYAAGWLDEASVRAIQDEMNRRVAAAKRSGPPLS